MAAERFEELEQSSQPTQKIAASKSQVEECTIDRISSSVLPMFSGKNTNVSFDLLANIWESGRRGTRVRVLFHLMIDAIPAVLRLEILGKAVISCPELKENTHLDDLGEDFASDLAIEIFRKNYESVYLLLGALNLPQPSPWVLKSVEVREPPRRSREALSRPMQLIR